MRFTKMQGLGNDYLYFYGSVPEDVQSLCPRLCDRHFGVGADGVIYVSPSQIADGSMRIFNADGSEARMCGNGIRCVGKYLYDTGLVRKDSLTVETLSGVKALTLTVEGGQVERVAVDMGRATLKQADLPLPEGMGAGTLISTGNPHLVIFVESAADLPLSLWGPRIQQGPRFPDGVNVEFVQVLSPTRLRMRVWERGCGVTLACGTGACASVFAAVQRGLCPGGEAVRVDLDGGTLSVTVAEEDSLSMAGPAVTVFQGEIEL